MVTSRLGHSPIERSYILRKERVKRICICKLAYGRCKTCGNGSRRERKRELERKRDERERKEMMGVDDDGTS